LIGGSGQVKLSAIEMSALRKLDLSAATDIISPALSCDFVLTAGYFFHGWSALGTYHSIMVSGGRFLFLFVSFVTGC
jgi:hypothetical protein